MKILGIDPALSIAGWGIIEVDKKNNKNFYISHGLIKSNPKDTIDKRLKSIYEKIQNVIEKYDPSCISIEKSFINCNATTSLLLGMARGCFITACAVLNIPISEYTPTHVKKSITGYGHADKEEVRKMLKYQITEFPDKITNDASDALAIALAHSLINPIFIRL